MAVPQRGKKHGRGGGDTSVKRRLWIFLTSLTVVCLYLTFGALAIRAMEQPEEDREIAAGEAEVNHMIADLNFTQDDLAKLEAAGLCNFHQAQKWTMSGSLFFTLTVITTIGYGSYAPRTMYGRFFTAIFAIIGIGVVGQLLASCALLLKNMGSGAVRQIRQRREEDPAASGEEPTEVEEEDEWEATHRALQGRLAGAEGGKVPAKNLAALLEVLTGVGVDPGVTHHILSVVDPHGTGEIPPAAQLRAVSLWYRVQQELPRGVSRSEGVLTIAGAASWILLWAALFMGIEGWEYSESLWFCLVSMTTIGFGDFVPASITGRMMCFLFIVPGLGLGAAALGLFWEAFEARRYWALQRRYAAGRCSRKLLEAHGIKNFLKDPRRCHARRDHYALRGQQDAANPGFTHLGVASPRRAGGAPAGRLRGQTMAAARAATALHGGSLNLHAVGPGSGALDRDLAQSTFSTSASVDAATSGRRSAAMLPAGASGSSPRAVIADVDGRLCAQLPAPARASPRAAPGGRGGAPPPAATERSATLPPPGIVLASVPGRRSASPPHPRWCTSPRDDAGGAAADATQDTVLYSPLHDPSQYRASVGSSGPPLQQGGWRSWSGRLASSSGQESTVVGRGKGKGAGGGAITS